MRLWTVHPRYLDAKGLVAAWREALLAQKVLQGHTRGYRHHPQLARFQSQDQPAAALATFLTGLVDEAQRRDYHFDATKISHPGSCTQIVETKGQLLYEWEHLRTKLRTRSPEAYQRIVHLKIPDAHPLFRIRPGPVRAWEKVV